MHSQTPAASHETSSPVQVCMGAVLMIGAGVATWAMLAVIGGQLWNHFAAFDAHRLACAVGAIG